jgi:hypothetical protein
MELDTAASRNRNKRRWPEALVVSLSLHVAFVVYAMTASRARREERPATPVVVTVMSEAPPLPPPAPATVVAPSAPVVAPRRPGTPANRSRPDRAANRLAPPPLALASADQPSPPAAAQASSLQGDLIVQAASTPAGKGAGLAGGAAPAANGSEASTAPRILPPAQGDGQLAIDPNEARYQPVIPPHLRKPGAKFAPLVKLCVRKDGSVGEVTVMRPSDPAVDPAIVEKLRLFKFRPYLDHGRPIPFCFFREYRLSVEE